MGSAASRKANDLNLANAEGTIQTTTRPKPEPIARQSPLRNRGKDLKETRAQRRLLVQSASQAFRHANRCSSLSIQ